MCFSGLMNTRMNDRKCAAKAIQVNNLLRSADVGPQQDRRCFQSLPIMSFLTKGMDVNVHWKLYNVYIQTNIKENEQRVYVYCCPTFHSYHIIFNYRHTAQPKTSRKRPESGVERHSLPATIKSSGYIPTSLSGFLLIYKIACSL